jgi:hypothetical protein
MDDLGIERAFRTLRGGGTDEYSVDSLTNRYTRHRCVAAGL